MEDNRGVDQPAPVNEDSQALPSGSGNSVPPLPLEKPAGSMLNDQLSQIFSDFWTGVQQLSPTLRRFFYQGKFKPAFWTVACLLSVIVNVILIVVIIFLGRYLFDIKDMATQVIGGLHENFVLMDQAHIQTTVTVSSTIQVQDAMPVVFDLPLSQNTSVILVDDTPISQATILLNGQWVPLDIILPQGTPLGITLDLVVPVSQTVPVNLKVPVQLQVPVDIALSETELHEPFVGLQEVVAPFNDLMNGMPDSWADTPLCTPFSGWLCDLLFEKE